MPEERHLNIMEVIDRNFPNSGRAETAVGDLSKRTLSRDSFKAGLVRLVLRVAFFSQSINFLRQKPGNVGPSE